MPMYTVAMPPRAIQEPTRYLPSSRCPASGRERVVSIGRKCKRSSPLLAALTAPRRSSAAGDGAPTDRGDPMAPDSAVNPASPAGPSCPERGVGVGGGPAGPRPIAGAAAAGGCRGTVPGGAAAPLTAAVGAEIGALTAPWYAAAGVELRPGQPVESVEPGGLALSGGGWLAADEIVTAVGVRPEVGWLEGSGSVLDHGVRAVEPLRRAGP